MEPRAYASGAAGTPPRLPATAQVGYPRAASGSDAATVPGPYWFLMNGEEARNLIIGGRIAPSVNDNTQMLQAIRRIARAAQVAQPPTGPV